MTAIDLVLRARAAGELAGLEEAERLARDAREWCAIAETAAIASDHRAVHALARARATAGTDVIVYRNIARIQRTWLADRAAAARTLTTCEDVLLEAPESAASWCRLAEAWHALGDRDTALYQLAHAAAFARSVADHCEVARCSAEVGGEVGLDSAAALARSARDHVELAAACDQLQDLDGQEAHLARAIDRCASAGDAVLVLRALARFGASTGDRVRCFERGAQSAVTSRDWLALLRVADDAHVPRCIERAEALGSADERLHLAFLTRRWDEPRPDRPPALRPSELLLDGARSLGWPHAPDALFERLRGAIGPEQLDGIARADYGMDYEAHLAALQAIVTTGRIPHPLFWEPAEVLQLVRWTTGPDTDHLVRAFACATLCLEGSGPASNFEGIESTVPILVHSALILGTAALDDALALLAAIANEQRESVERAFVELGLLVAAIWRDPDDRRIAPLLDRLVHDEAAMRRDGMGVAEGWLLGLTHFDLKHALWRELVRCVAVDPGPAASRLADLVR